MFWPQLFMWCGSYTDTAKCQFIHDVLPIYRVSTVMPCCCACTSFMPHQKLVTCPWCFCFEHGQVGRLILKTDQTLAFVQSPALSRTVIVFRPNVEMEHCTLMLRLRSCFHLACWLICSLAELCKKYWIDSEETADGTTKNELGFGSDFRQQSV